jgi:hypothetical protein
MKEYLSTLTYIVVWLVFWAAAWRAFYGPMRLRGIDYIHRSVLTAGYFFILSLFAAAVFGGPLGEVVTAPGAAAWGALAGMFALQFGLYFAAKSLLRKPTAMIEANPLEFFLRLDFRYLFSKSFEVLFQQTMIVALVATLSRAVGNLVWVCLLFAAVFAMGHLPMIHLFGNQTTSFARFYIAAAVASAAVFPPLILKVPGGPVYAYIVHSLFYTILALVLWVKHTAPPPGNRNGTK